MYTKMNKIILFYIDDYDWDKKSVSALPPFNDFIDDNNCIV